MKWTGLILLSDPPQSLIEFCCRTQATSESSLFNNPCGCRDVIRSRRAGTWTTWSLPPHKSLQTKVNLYKADVVYLRHRLCVSSDSQQDPGEQRLLQDADGRAGGVVHEHRHILSSLQTHKHKVLTGVTTASVCICGQSAECTDVPPWFC